MKTIIKLFLPVLLIFVVFSACTAEKQIDIFILLKRYSNVSEKLKAEENSVYLTHTDGEKKYSVPLTLNGEACGLLTAYPDEYGNLKSAAMTSDSEDGVDAMRDLVCAFTGLAEGEAYDIIKELTEPPVSEKIRYTQRGSHRFTYTVKEPGYYFSVEDIRYVSTEDAEFTLRQTTSLISSQ